MNNYTLKNQTMKFNYMSFWVFILILSNGCGVPQSEVTELKAQIEELKLEIDDCKNGADKLLAKANQFYEQKEYRKAEHVLGSLKSKFPAAFETEKVKVLVDEVALSIENQAIQKKKDEEEKRKILANATRQMNKKYDDISEITWYRDKSSPYYTNSNGFFAYIGKPDNGSPYLRLRIQYADDDWLFIERYIIKVDGVTYTISEENYGEIEKDNGSGLVWEWLDRNVSDKEMRIIKAVATGKEVKIRYVGNQYHRDRTITTSQKKALTNVLNAYEALGGRL